MWTQAQGCSGSAAAARPPLRLVALRDSVHGVFKLAGDKSITTTPTDRHTDTRFSARIALDPHTSNRRRWSATLSSTTRATQRAQQPTSCDSIFWDLVQQLSLLPALAFPFAFSLYTPQACLVPQSAQALLALAGAKLPSSLVRSVHPCSLPA